LVGHPCDAHEVHFDYSVVGNFNLFQPSASSQLVYDGGTSHYINITWSDTNEFHEGYHLHIWDCGFQRDVYLPSYCHSYNYDCYFGSSNVYAKVQAYIGDSTSEWSNTTVTRNAPHVPARMRAHVLWKCGSHEEVRKLAPGEQPSKGTEVWLPVENQEGEPILAPEPGWEPPCYQYNMVKVIWEDSIYQEEPPDYWMVRLLFYTTPPSVYWIGPIYEREIEFCSWPEWEHRLSVVAYKYGLHSNETEDMRLFTTGGAICYDYPFGKGSPDGGRESLAEISSSTPDQFSLFQNHPNPFNPETDISYNLPKEYHVKLTIFNVMGQKVRTLVDEDQIAGQKTVYWDGKDENGQGVASGIYFYKLSVGAYTETKKMLLLR